MNKITSSSDYTSYGNSYQLVLPLDVALLIPADDSVRLLDAVLERVDYGKLYAAYSRIGRIERSPKNLFKVLVYGYMNGIYSSRKLEQACRRDVNFMYLLSGEKAPDHSTIARFRSERLTEVVEDLFRQLVDLLANEGELSLTQVFIDGTKIEASANKYTFVWRKAVQKNETKMQKKMHEELPGLAKEFGLEFFVEGKIETKDLESLLESLASLKGDSEFVYGKGKRKSPLQRAIEAVEGYLARQKNYDDHNATFGERNSFSKTDKDATFMRMKEDHMRNGQLKAAYNVTIAVDAEYIVGTLISADRSDSKTFIPMMEKLLPFGYSKPVADAGYESEENYAYCKETGLTAFIKPANHEKAKTRKYKNDIGLRENMPYDEKTDTYTCHAGYPLVASYEKETTTATGYLTVTTVYTCKDCEGCLHKAKCIKGKSKKPMEERSKSLHVAKTFQEHRQKMSARIQNAEGILLRINRSIQVEGAFGVLKEDMGFRRFLHRGKTKVETEFMLLAMAFNVNKLHSKIQTGRCGAYLHSERAA